MNFKQLKDEIKSLQDRERGLLVELRDCEQIAGKALGYSWYKDDPKNFPDATEVDGVCVGSHSPATVVQELANKFNKKSEDEKPQ